MAAAATAADPGAAPGELMEAALTGNTWALYELATGHYSEHAMHPVLLALAAHESPDDPRAHYQLGRVFLHGDAGVGKDAKMARLWLHRFSNQEYRDASALYAAAVAAANSSAVISASEYADRAAINNQEGDSPMGNATEAAVRLDTKSVYNLGVIYLQGLYGVERDEAIGALFFDWVAEHGEMGIKARADGMSNLAACYMDGRGVERDEHAAWYYANRAADLNSTNGIAMVEKMQIASGGTLIVYPMRGPRGDVYHPLDHAALREVREGRRKLFIMP